VIGLLQCHCKFLINRKSALLAVKLSNFDSTFAEQPKNDNSCDN
jgi:hypothetical protein